MFVQHIISTLKSTGRMAVIMPHGVLFRGGEERKMREWMIRRGYLEAVIGLPPALFYGTGIPASILIINRAGAAPARRYSLSMPTTNTNLISRTNYDETMSGTSILSSLRISLCPLVSSVSMCIC